MLKTLRAVAGSLAVVVCTAMAATAQDSETLYTCVDAAATRTLEIGATVCDAAPTDALTTRMEADNLQLRTGGLVTEVVTGGVAQVAGLEEGDVIYRVGGVDVDSNVKVAARLSLIEESSDTVVNFLRRGRPYRVKIRRP
ncbi:MAG: hypothetical protein CL477_06810 [Acidobacteria bacterium]|jgi:C-terminal processing protease CtpA/Prc|nr:hypothetical protein [Acidobacteriota bacterium]HJN45845.1 PDZ domain-containing protein [Vicinamibacterales bacterium]|tara:strand:+ start:282 stop:701 length:420 start_codon:yes stop_codon:yes gene_type:complete